MKSFPNIVPNGPAFSRLRDQMSLRQLTTPRTFHITLNALHVSSLHRSVRDRILLPSRTKGQSQNPRPDLSRPHRRRHRPLRRRLHPDRQKTWSHLLSRTKKQESEGFSDRRESLNDVQSLAVADRSAWYLGDLWVMLIKILVTLLGQWRWMLLKFASWIKHFC